MTTSRITEEKKELSWGSLFIIYKSTNQYKSEDSWADWFRNIHSGRSQGRLVSSRSLLLKSDKLKMIKLDNCISVSQSLFFRSNDNFRLYDSFMKLSQCGKIEITRQAQSQNWIEAIYSKGRVGYIEGQHFDNWIWNVSPVGGRSSLLEIKPSIIQQSRGKLD